MHLQYNLDSITFIDTCMNLLNQNYLKDIFMEYYIY